MKKNITVIKIIMIIIVIFPNPVWASTLSLSPSSAGLSEGEIAQMDINLTTKSGETVNALSAYLSYPRDSMKIEWITYQNSFNITTEELFQDGNIKITRGNINPQSGVLKVGTIGFTPTKSGTLRLSFLSGSAAPSAADSKDTLDLTNSEGVTYQVAAKQPGSTDAPAVTTSKKILPKIDQISVSAIATNSAVVAWQTDIAADSFAQYGVEKGKYTFTEYDSKFVTDHKLKISGSHLKAGTQYYLRIKSKDSSGNLSTSEEMAIQLLGENQESIFQKAPDVEKLGPLPKNLSYAIGASLVMILLAILVGFLIWRKKKKDEGDSDPYLGSD